MTKLNVRLPDHLIRKIDAEARTRRIPKAAVVREWLSLPTAAANPLRPGSKDNAHPIGSARDLSARKKDHLRRK